MSRFIYLQPEQPEQLPLQVESLFFPQLSASGQPMHFFPLFLALYIYNPARITITATIIMTIISSIKLPRDYLVTVSFFLDLSSYSALSFAFALTQRNTITATKTRTAIRPGRKPAPSEPVVIRVPI